MNRKNISRRKFIGTTTATIAGATIFPSNVIAGLGHKPPSDKLNIAGIGVGGKGYTNLRNMETENIVALCDVDWDYAGKNSFKRWPLAKKYKDYRDMFEQQKDIDAVMIATPDHTHALPAVLAMREGMHAFVQKPLTHSVYESRVLRETANRYGVATQMGNQGNSAEGIRQVCEWIWAGTIGEVTHVDTWTNRPIWPQGLSKPTKSKRVPDYLDWDAWIGAAPVRPFAGPRENSKKGRGPYHPFNWRGVVDFGSGALGDMACHTTDGIYAIMKPGYAATAEPIVMTGPCTDQYPLGMVVKSTYRPKGDRPGFTTFWYEGKDKNGKPFMPEVPDELKSDGRDLPRTGNLVVGTKGKMLVQGDYWDSPRLIPQSKASEFGKPEQTIERSPGHHEEFFMACRGEKPREFSRSNYSYSGPMAANIQLGNLCARAGKKLELNKAGKITNYPAINDLAWREPRKGWGPLEMKI
ncbi:MAG: Gfo/Idh/MocA family oxidoreductase [Gammaproteobacteria bacterium]|nr:Gfo/Idh/MocA family oxidoreductase [Gammaproteobacteria bacterium]